MTKWKRLIETKKNAIYLYEDKAGTIGSVVCWDDGNVSALIYKTDEHQEKYHVCRSLTNAKKWVEENAVRN